MASDQCQLIGDVAHLTTNQCSVDGWIDATAGQCFVDGCALWGQGRAHVHSEHELDLRASTNLSGSRGNPFTCYGTSASPAKDYSCAGSTPYPYFVTVSFSPCVVVQGVASGGAGKGPVSLMYASAVSSFHMCRDATGAPHFTP